MWLMGRLLPILVGSCIPDDDLKWKNYLLLLDIVDILFSRRITDDMPGVLHDYIREHHTSFTELYPTESVTPKMHFLVHTPRIMME